MTEPLKWGILGNATIARRCVIPAIQKCHNAEVHALASQSPIQSRPIAEQYCIKNLYDSYDALLDDAEVEAVYIPLPNHLHYYWTMKALKAGKHVLCEKPLACNAEQARDMAATSEKAGVLLMEAFMYRFHPRSRIIKQMVAEGTIGTPRLVRSAFCYSLDGNLMETGYCSRLNPAMGGGALLDVGCYGVSLIRWLLDSEPVQLQGQAAYRHGVDVHFAALLRFSEDRLATLEASFISALQQTYSIAGEEKTIELPHNAFIPWDNETIFTLREKNDESGEIYRISGADEYQLMVDHFTRAVRGKTSLAYGPEESIRNLQVLDGLAESAREGKTITLI